MTRDRSGSAKRFSAFHCHSRYMANAEAKNWQRAMRTATSLEPERPGFDESGINSLDISTDGLMGTNMKKIPVKIPVYQSLPVSGLDFGLF